MSIFKQYNFQSSPSSVSTINIAKNSIIGFSVDEQDFMSFASTVQPKNYSISFITGSSTIPIELGKTHIYETDDFIIDSGRLEIPANPPESLKINITTFQEGGNS